MTEFFSKVGEFFEKIGEIFETIKNLIVTFTESTSTALETADGLWSNVIAFLEVNPTLQSLAITALAGVGIVITLAIIEAIL